MSNNNLDTISLAIDKPSLPDCRVMGQHRIMSDQIFWSQLPIETHGKLDLIIDRFDEVRDLIISTGKTYSTKEDLNCCRDTIIGKIESENSELKKLVKELSEELHHNSFKSRAIFNSTLAVAVSSCLVLIGVFFGEIRISSIFGFLSLILAIGFWIMAQKLPNE